MEDKTKLKISATMKGRKQYVMTDEIRKKISEAKKGKTPWNKGKPAPWVTKCKKGKKITDKQRLALIKANTGRIHTKEEREKRSLSTSGKNHYNWQGGKTSINKDLRSGIKYREWREGVFKRDNYTCQKCETRCLVINSHHIYNLSSNSDICIDIKNGITLCEKCHKKFHHKYGRKNNNKKQLIVFLNN